MSFSVSAHHLRPGGWWFLGVCAGCSPTPAHYRTPGPPESVKFSPRWKFRLQGEAPATISPRTAGVGGFREFLDTTRKVESSLSVGELASKGPIMTAVEFLAATARARELSREVEAVTARCLKFLQKAAEKFRTPNAELPTPTFRQSRRLRSVFRDATGHRGRDGRVAQCPDHATDHIKRGEVKIMPNYKKGLLGKGSFLGPYPGGRRRSIPERTRHRAACRWRPRGQPGREGRYRSRVGTYVNLRRRGARDRAMDSRRQAGTGLQRSRVWQYLHLKGKHNG